MDNNGYIEKKKGEYIGELSIDGVDISPIVGIYFKDKGKHWLWIKRKRILEYDIESQSFRTRNPSPMFEIFLKKEKQGSPIAYKGICTFFRFKYTMTAVWDKFSKDKERLNLYVDRLPLQEQNIINKLKQIKDERIN